MKNRIGSALCFKRSDSTGSTKFIWDQENVITETDDADVTQVVYTLEPLTYGNLISQKRGATPSYYLFNAFGSTHQLTDGSATMTDNYTYEAFGSIRASSGSTTNPITFVGELGYWSDPDLIVQYIRARYYDPPNARWLSQDPIFSDNQFGYVRNRPTAIADPKGLVPFLEQNESHHWFTKKTGEKAVNTRFPDLRLRIDDFTSFYIGGFRGTPHSFIMSAGTQTKPPRGAP